MNGERLKTIGVDKQVWLRLKHLAIAHDCTLSEAIDYLMTRSDEGGTETGEAEELGGNERRGPDQST